MGTSWLYHGDRIDHLRFVGGGGGLWIAPGGVLAGGQQLVVVPSAVSDPAALPVERRTRHDHEVDLFGGDGGASFSGRLAYSPYTGHQIGAEIFDPEYLEVREGAVDLGENKCLPTLNYRLKQRRGIYFGINSAIRHDGGRPPEGRHRTYFVHDHSPVVAPHGGHQRFPTLQCGGAYAGFIEAQA